MTDEVLCGEVVTLALDWLMSNVFGFLDISFSGPLSNLLRSAGLLLGLWGLQVSVICRVLRDFISGSLYQVVIYRMRLTVWFSLDTGVSDRFRIC
jgi:hypothetical protein